jgi:hypothetical protein
VQLMTTTPPLAPTPDPDGWTVPDLPESCPVRVQLFRIAQAVRDLREAGTPPAAVEVLADWARGLLRQHTALTAPQRALAAEHLDAGASMPVALRRAAEGTSVQR